MVEHSVVINDEVVRDGPTDYMHALFSAKTDQAVLTQQIAAQEAS